MQPMGRGRRHERVVAGVKLHLINAVAESAVAFELRREHIGQPRVLLHLGAARQRTQRMQRRGVQARRMTTQSVLHRQVAGEQIDIHKGRSLVKDFVRGLHGSSYKKRYRGAR